MGINFWQKRRIGILRKNKNPFHSISFISMKKNKSIQRRLVKGFKTLSCPSFGCVYTKLISAKTRAGIIVDLRYLLLNDSATASYQ